MKELFFTELVLLRSELLCVIDSLQKLDFSVDSAFHGLDFQRVRYKRLVRLYDKIDDMILEMIEKVGL